MAEGDPSVIKFVAIRGSFDDKVEIKPIEVCLTDFVNI